MHGLVSGHQKQNSNIACLLQEKNLVLVSEMVLPDLVNGDKMYSSNNRLIQTKTKMFFIVCGFSPLGSQQRQNCKTLAEMCSI